MGTTIQMRPYQQAAREAIKAEWGAGHLRTLLVLPTGCGKTVVFAKIAEDQVRAGEHVLILAHRGELLDQAADKLRKTTGLSASVEKAEETSIDSWCRVTVGSVQTLMRQKRLDRFAPDHFGTIVIDEAHHAISDSYQKILDYFDGAKVLGVTATPDRGDMKNLGQVFDSLAYEYTLPQAIKDGFLCKIKALTVPLKLDISQVSVTAGDFSADEIGTALDPYLEQIASEMENVCKGRKTVVFLPLVATSKKFRAILEAHGFRAAEVNGKSEDRADVLADFDAGSYDVLCNSMLLTEGWDCPTVDCICVLRPTKSRALYSQMVGRGTRLAEGKDHLLLLDFLWLTEKHELCRPADLICGDREQAQQMTQDMEASAGGEPEDIEAAADTAADEVMQKREEALAKQLAEMRKRKRKLVDPLQYEMSIMDKDLSDYVPSFGWEAEPAQPKQKERLEKLGIFPDDITAGKADRLLQSLSDRRMNGLTTPKQIRFLEGRGFRHVGGWTFDSARKLIDRIAANNWQVPHSISPATYSPPSSIDIEVTEDWTKI